MPTEYQNTLLKNLDAGIVERLQLRPIELPLLFDLEISGEPICYLYFLEAGIASMTTRFENGLQVETGMIGYESVVGLSALMGSKNSLNPIFMQLNGHGHRAPLKAARTEFQRLGAFQNLMLRSVQAQLTLSAQNAACNAAHTYEQRLARWLLICADRARSDEFKMAQEFVSQMLGSTRSTVSIAAAHLKNKGLIDYHRGSIKLLNKKELEIEACECYRAVRDYLENYMDFDTGLVE